MYSEISPLCLYCDSSVLLIGVQIGLIGVVTIVKLCFLSSSDRLMTFIINRDIITPHLCYITAII